MASVVVFAAGVVHACSRDAPGAATRVSHGSKVQSISRSEGVAATRTSKQASPAPGAGDWQKVPQPEPTPVPAAVVDRAPQALRERMKQFEDALRAEDTTGFLRLFARSKPWREINTLGESNAARLVTFERLASDLQAKRGLYEILFDAGGDDCLRDYVTGEHAKPWRWLGDGRFGPVDISESTVWVRWRRDRGEWVVDAIAQSSA